MKQLMCCIICLVLLEGSGVKIEDVMEELKKRQNGIRQK